jgi:hypothetical protein
MFSQVAAETAEYLRACARNGDKKDLNAAAILRAAYQTLPFLQPNSIDPSIILITS